jgi:hypothetical protein
MHLERGWRLVLSEYGLPFFHMSECAHGTGVFKSLTRTQRIDVEKKMIGIIKRRVEKGFAVTIDEACYRSVMGDYASGNLGGAYSWCLNSCLHAVTHWAETYNISGKVNYQFESGHSSQQEANRIMNNLFSIPAAREKHRYLSHGFADKKEVCGLQAADLLAWQWATDYKRKLARKPRRDDLSNLLEKRHSAMHWAENNIQDLRRFAEEVEKTTDPNELGKIAARLRGEIN